MRIVRRAALVLSLVLIVAIAVGYVLRTSELERERDLGLATSSELGAAHLTSIVDATTVAARAAVDPEPTAEALASVHAGLGVCAVGWDQRACAGDGPMPATAVLDREAARRAEGNGNAPSGVSVYDQLMTITVAGDRLTVFVVARADLVDVDENHPVSATTLLPAGVDAGMFTVSNGQRQTSTSVLSSGLPLPDLYVSATGLDDVSLPTEEYRFYVVIFALAVVLLLLAGVTMFVEQRNLLERASFDPLTKLPNRSEFERRASSLLANAERLDEGLSLLLFDLNGFKYINDTYGHRAGDEMLKIVGSRLRKAVREGDVVARWGGDEFVVVMPGVATEEMGGRRAHQLAEQICGRTRLEGVADPLRVKVSVGVAVWPHHATDLDSMVVAADKAMYDAKRGGVTCRIAAVVPDAPQVGEARPRV